MRHAFTEVSYRWWLGTGYSFIGSKGVDTDFGQRKAPGGAEVLQTGQENMEFIARESEPISSPSRPKV